MSDIRNRHIEALREWSAAEDFPSAYDMRQVREHFGRIADDLIVLEDLVKTCRNFICAPDTQQKFDHCGAMNATQLSWRDIYVSLRKQLEALSPVVCEHGIPEGEFCGHCAMVEV